MSNSEIARHLVIPGCGLALIGAFAVFYVAYPVLYFDILTAWGLNPFRFPFLDSHAVLSALECKRLAYDVYVANPCDVLNRPHIYSPLFLAAAILPASVDQTTIIGIVLVLAFFVALAALPPPQGWLGWIVTALATLSMMTAYAVERGNVDLLIFVLATAASCLLLRSWGARWFGYALILFAGFLKYYPLALMILSLREKPRRFAILAAGALIATGIFLAHYHAGIAQSFAVMPHGSYFTDFFGAGDLPNGMTLLLAPFGDSHPWAAPILPYFPWLLLAALIVSGGRQALALAARPNLPSELAPLPAPHRIFLGIGATLIVGCFFAGQNVDYSGIFFLMLLPGGFATGGETSRALLGALTPLKRATLERIPVALAVLVAAAFLLRLGVYVLFPNIVWPDEIFQVLEPAHRLVFGTGLVSWEWVVGMRSWALPGFVAGLMEIGRLFGDRPETINLPVILFFIAASCAPVICGYGWGRRFHGTWGGIIGGGVAAIWIDLVYMAPHTLTEVLAADCLVIALYLGYLGEGSVSRRRLFAAGLLLGLTFILRFHLAPALVVAFIGMAGFRKGLAPWRTLAAGASVPLILSGILDWATLGTPFQSVWLNIWMNLGLGISGEAGTAPFFTPFALLALIWGIAASAVMLITAVAGARRLPLLFAVAFAIFLTHALIPHKEYRFTYPAIPLLSILGGLGTAEFVAKARDALARRHRPIDPALLTGVSLALWAGLSLQTGLRPIFDVPWTRERAEIDAFAYVSHHPEICGVGLYKWHWVVTPGESWLPATVPLYQVDGQPGQTAAFNALIGKPQIGVPDTRYRQIECFSGDRQGAFAHVQLCVWERDGGCNAAASAPPPTNWPRHFTGEPPPPEDEDSDAEQ